MKVYTYDQGCISQNRKKVSNKENINTKYEKQKPILKIDKDLKGLMSRKQHQNKQFQNIKSNESTFSNVLARTVVSNHTQSLASRHSAQSQSLISHKKSCIKKCKSGKNVYREAKYFKRKQYEDSCSFSKQKTEKYYAENKRRVNDLILLRIRQTLQNFPNLIQSKKLNKRLRPINFETQQSVPLVDNSSQIINLSKLVLWTEKKLTKTIDNIYKQIIHRNIKNGYNNNFITKNEDENQEFLLSESIQKLITVYLMNKYRTDKLCRQNFINICYSLYYHIDKASLLLNLQDQNAQFINKMKIRYYSVFEGILNRKFDMQDTIFYAYSKKQFQQIVRKNSSLNYFDSYIVTYKQLRLLFNSLFNEDSELIIYYESYVKKQFMNRNGFVDILSVLHLLVCDFRAKKQSIKIEQSIQSFIDHSLQKDAKLQNQGKQYKFIHYQYNKKFWFLKQPFLNIPQEIFTIFEAQIKKQSYKLVSILCKQLPIQYQSFINQLLVIKAKRMLNFVYQMNKIAWFQEMGINSKNLNEKQKLCEEDFQQIQQLQINFNLLANKIKNKVSLPHNRIIWFVKKLLTPRILIYELQKLIEQFEKLAVNNREI